MRGGPWVRLRDGSTGQVLGERVRVAADPWARAVGLLGCSGLGPGGGLILVHCGAVHTFGMRFPIEAVFLDGSGGMTPRRGGGRVLRRCRLEPWRLGPLVRGAHVVVELPLGGAAAVQPGDWLCWESLAPTPAGRAPGGSAGAGRVDTNEPGGRGRGRPGAADGWGGPVPFQP